MSLPKIVIWSKIVIVFQMWSTTGNLQLTNKAELTVLVLCHTLTQKLLNHMPDMWNIMQNKLILKAVIVSQGTQSLSNFT